MTIIEALKSKVGYPLPDNSYEVAITTRGLVSVDTFDPLGSMQAFELAYADILSGLVTMPNSVSEGGFSISAGDREKMQGIANQIYSKYAVASPVPKTNPVGRFVSKW